MMKKRAFLSVHRNVFFLLLAIGFAAAGLAQDFIGVAKKSTRLGRQIQYDFYIENFSATVEMIDLSLDEDLDTVFGAGTYTVQSLSKTSGPGSVIVNASFDGSSDTEMLNPSSTLAAGQTAQLTLLVEVDSVTDQGFGVGVYQNQVTILAGDADENTYSDLSDFGTDPDPNGNGDPTEGGEDDPTRVSLTENATIGAAKDVNLNGTQVTFDFYLENFGNVTVSSLALVDDLDTSLGAGNYTILSAPSFLQDPGTITLNPAFNGSGDTNLIDSGSLSNGATAQLRIVVDVTNVVDLGSGLGVYSNQASFSGLSPTLQNTADDSDYGTDPDPNGNGNPREGDENDPTTFVLGEEGEIGVAKSASVSGSTVTVDFYLENLGNVDLSNIDLEDSLNATFGAGTFYVSTGPTLIDDPGTLTLNAGYDGNFDHQLLFPGASTLTSGDTAQIQMQVFILAISDQGFGVGNYENQATVTGQAPGGSLVSDISDDGTDPDPNGNGNPDETGENDPTPITIAPQASIGVAKQYISGGVIGGLPYVTLKFTLTNYGNQTVSSITISDNLNSVYGAGNFSHIADPTYVSGAPTLTYNSSFNGNTNTSLLNAGSSLDPGETSSFIITSRINNITDQGFGLGVYQNQVTVNGLDPSAAPVSDQSTTGSDPDPNGNGIPDENDPTVIDVNVTESIGIAKDANVAGSEVTLDFYLENLGSANFENLSFVDNLDIVFGAGNYFISTPPFFVDDPGTITLNPGYGGTLASQEFLSPASSSLSAGDTAQIQMVVTVTNVENQGLGLGNYSNQVTLIGQSEFGSFFSDISDFGTDPDPDGDGNANEGGENDATSFSITVDSPIGVAKQAAVAGFDVTIDLYLENLGVSLLSNVALTEDLDATLGAGNYTITSAPAFIVDPGTLNLNGGFDGSGDSQILSAGSSLGAGATAQIQLVVNVHTESDQGLGYGVYSNSVLASALQPNGVVVSDYSDDGTDPDPNGNGDPGEAGEDDPTPIVITGNPAIGIAKKAYVNGTLVTFDFYIENLGDTTLSNVFMEDPLNPVFGSGNYSIMTQPQHIDGPGTLSLSPQYFGFNIFSRIVLNGILRPGETEHIRVQIAVNTVSDVGNGFGVYFNGVTVTANDPGGNLYQDDSDDGYDPDPNSNGNAGDAGEDDDTQIIIGDEANLGVAKNVSVTGQQVTFDYYLENFGGSVLSSLSLIEDLDEVFGSGNYTINGTPGFIDDPGTITLNPTFDGSGDQELMGAGSTLAALDTAQIQIVIDVTTLYDQLGDGPGKHSNQITFSGDAPLGAFASDLSDFGTNPDPNANSFANDSDEGDPTPFTVYAATGVVGASKTATVSGRQVRFDFYIENMGNPASPGTDTLQNVSLEEDLDTLFGAGNYTIITPPTLDAVHLTTLNPNYDGSSDTELIGGGTIAPSTLEHFHMVVEVNELIDAGSGLGVYSNQVTVNADTLSNNALSDLSDDGTDPDPNGNGDPTEAGEEDPTLFSIAEDGTLGVAKTAAVSGRNVTLDFYLESFANVVVSSVSLTENLNTLFGAANYSITSPPALIVDPGTLILNAGYDGSADPDLLDASSTLAIGATAQIRMVLNVTTVTDQGFGLGNYENQVTLAGQSPNGSPFSDTSDDGTDPDPDGDGNPNEAGENDPTSIVLEGDIGDFVWNDLNGDGVFDAGEPALAGVTVYLDSNTNGSLDGGESNQTTNASGFFNFTNLPADTYSVQVDASTVPVGFVLTTANVPDNVALYSGQDYNDADFGYQQQDAMIGDFVWNDLDGDGAQDAGEPGIAGVTIYLDLNSNGVFDAGEPSDTTDGSGAYDITNLPTGNYEVRADASTIPAGFVLTGGTDPHTVSLAAGQDYNDADFGFQQQDATIGDFVWNDLNGDGVQDGGEPGLSGVTVYLDLNSNGSLDGGEPSDTTDGAGAYDIINLPLGTYDVQIDGATVPAGFVLTGGALPTSVSIVAGEDYNDADFGFQQQDASIGDFVWNDLDGDGVQDAGEPGLSGIDVFLDVNSNGVLDAGEPNDTTDASGAYDIANLATGTYAVQVDFTTVPVGFVQTGGSIPPQIVNLAAGEDFNDADFGFQQQNASIGDFVWNDLDGNGVQDAGEPGISGVTVFLDFNSNGSLDGGEPSLATDGAGSYDFTGLAAGSYSVQLDATTVTTGYAQTGGTNPQLVMLGAGEDYNNADFGFQQQDASIGDFVWTDLNGDGVQDAGEPGISGVTVFLDTNNNGTLDGGEPNQATTALGSYDFTNLPTGTYNVQVDLATVTAGFALTGGTLPTIVNLAAGEDFNTADFGFQQQDATIGDRLWNDLNADGVQDGGEAGINGVTIDLYRDNNNDGIIDGGDSLVSSQPTAGDGDYDFTNLPTGDYLVSVTDTGALLTGFVQTGGTTPHDVSLAAGQDYNDADFGYQQQDASIGDFVWNDLNGDGVQDAGEPGIDGITIDLYLDNNNDGVIDGGDTLVSGQTTAAGGTFDFSSLPAGDYLVSVTDTGSLLTGFVLTGSTVPHDVTLAAGQDYNLADFGYQQQDATVGDFVWNDLNGDGVQDAGEPGIDGVTVDLYRDNNNDGTVDGGDTLVTGQTTSAGGTFDFTNLPAGDYLVDITDTGSVLTGFVLTGGTDPHDVALTAGEDYNMADFGYQQQDAQIGDFVWDDQNGDGVQDAGEPGLPGVTVFLDLNTNGSLDAGEPSGVSDGAGNYDIANLATGTYEVQVDASTVPIDFVLTTGTLPLIVTIAAGEDYNDADFGYQLRDASIDGMVWNDLNGDGIMDAGEPGLDGWTIELLPSGGGPALDSTTSAGGGLYSFANLAPGSYEVQVSPASGFVLTGGTNPTSVTLTTSQVVSNVDFGYQQQDASIGDLVFNDLDGNGVLDAGEPGLANVTVELHDDNNKNGVVDAGEALLGSTTTDANGLYQFPALPAGNYTISVTDTNNVLTGFVLTAGTNPTPLFVVTAGQAVNDIDFGYQQQDATIGDFVWNDLNGDGVQDVGEAGLAGVTIFIDSNSNATLDAGELFSTTDGSGNYDLIDLPMGTYALEVDSNTVPANFVLVTPTTPHMVTIAAGEDRNDADFGFQQQDASIGDLVYHDLDGNGQLDPGEPGLAGVTLDLYDDSNKNGQVDAGEALLGSTTTDANGNYSFPALPVGNYQVDVTDTNGILTNFLLTDGTDPFPFFTLSVGEVRDDIDFGYLEELAGLGIAKAFNGYSDIGSDQVELSFTFTVSNLGNVALSDLQVTDDLRVTFPTPVDFIVTQLASPTLNVNPGFDGEADTNLLTGADTLAIGESAQIILVLLVTPNGAAGTYYNTAEGSTYTPLGNLITDISDEGDNPDANGNGVGNDVGEDDPTAIFFPARVPTLGQWGLMVFVALFTIIGVLMLRRTRTL